MWSEMYFIWILYNFWSIKQKKNFEKKKIELKKNWIKKNLN